MLCEKGAPRILAKFTGKHSQENIHRKTFTGKHSQENIHRTPPVATSGSFYKYSHFLLYNVRGG